MLKLKPRDIERQKVKEMVQMSNSGTTVREEANFYGIGYNTAYSKITRSGATINAIKSHPISRYYRSSTGARVGSIKKISFESADMIAAEQAKRGGTLWEAADRLIIDYKKTLS